MSTTMKIVISAIAVGALLAAPAVAGTRVHHPANGHRAADHRAFGGAYGGGPAYGRANSSFAMPRTGEKYFGPYDERIVTLPNGTVLGTDPDPSIRSQMRRDIGPNGNGASNPGM